MNKTERKHGNVLFLNPQQRVLLKAILLMAIPVALQTIISVGINMVDTMMVGALGETQLTAVSQASQLFFIFQLTLFGTTGGANVLIAQYWGKQDRNWNAVSAHRLSVVSVFWDYDSDRQYAACGRGCQCRHGSLACIHCRKRIV